MSLQPSAAFINAVAVTPSDTVALAVPSGSIWVGGAGNLKVVMVGSATAVTFTGVLAGTLLPIKVAQVVATLTTATNIVSLS